MGSEEIRLQQMGDNVRWVRHRLGLSQKELGEFLGLSRATINRIENGHALLRTTKMEKLAHFAELPVEYLLYGPDYPRLDKET